MCLFIYSFFFSVSFSVSVSPITWIRCSKPLGCIYDILSHQCLTIWSQNARVNFVFVVILFQVAFQTKWKKKKKRKKFHKIVFCVVLMAFSFWLIWWWVFLSNFNLIAWQLLLSLSNKMFMSMYVLIYSHVDNNSFNFSLELLFTKTKCQKRVIWYESCLSVSTTNTELKSETDRKSKREKKNPAYLCSKSISWMPLSFEKNFEGPNEETQRGKNEIKIFLNRCAHSFLFPGTQYCVCVVFHQIGGSFSIILLFLFNLYTFHFIQIHSGLRFHTPDLFIVFIFVNEMLSNNAIRLHTHTAVHCLWVFFNMPWSKHLHSYNCEMKKKMFNNRITYAINNNACGSNFFFSLLFLSLHWTIWCGNNLESMVFIT